MPVNDLGYRAWRGTRAARMLRGSVVARSGISLVLRRKALRYMLMFAWLPVIVPAFGIFAFESSSTSPDLQHVIFVLLRGPLRSPELAAQILSDPDSARHEVWSTLILAFFRYPQLFTMVLLVGMIAPMLISYDLRTKAYLLYFSRPLTPTQYIAGKSAVIWFLLVMVVTIPALALYLIGVLLSPDLSVVKQTWDIPLKILAATCCLAIPTTSLAIAYSSLTSESRHATFTWFATWLMGFVAYHFLTFSVLVGSGPPRRSFRRGPLDFEELGIDLDRWRLLSPYHTLGKVQSWIFGLDTSTSSVLPSIVVLVAITVIGFWIVRRRLVARLSI